MFENMAKQMIQHKQLQSNASFEEELDIWRNVKISLEVAKKSSKLDA